jgi:hypothetical protein
VALSQYDVQHILFWWKVVIYRSVVALTLVALGLAPKKNAHQLNIYTTQTIFYSTLSISLAELVIALSLSSKNNKA